MRYLFIANPTAGKGKTKNLLSSIQHYLDKKKIDYQIIITSKPGDVINIAKKNEGEFDRIIVIGGDGTIHELLNANVINNKTLGVLPTGSGNDFALTLGLKKNLYKDLDTLLNEKTLDLDIGYCELTEFTGRKINFLFANSLGIGFDAEVAYSVKSIKFLRGLVLYLIGVFKTLVRYNFRKVEIILDDKKLNEEVFMISIGNGKTAGGGFKLTPLANPIDGQLDVCIVKKLSKLKVLYLLPLAIFGKHLGNKSVMYFKVKEMYITSNLPIYLHADGEIRSNDLKSTKIILLSRYAKFITDGVSYNVNEKT